MNTFKSSDPNSYYKEVDGEVLPPDSGDYYQEHDEDLLFDDQNSGKSIKLDDKIVGPKERGKIIAEAFTKFPDELTIEVYPSNDMEKAYEVARRLLGLNDDNSTDDKGKARMVASRIIELNKDSSEKGAENELLDQEVNVNEIEKGQTRSVKWKTENGRRIKYTVPVAFVIKVKNGARIYLESKNKIPENGASAFLVEEWVRLEEKIDNGEGTQI